MYLVAMTILKTDRGIVFVGHHETDRDAQKVFDKVIDFIFTLELQISILVPH